MRVLLDNTLLHRVGHIIEAAPEIPIRSIDVVALFHMIEHILFSDNLHIPTYQRMFSHERTLQVSQALMSRGVTDNAGQGILEIETWDASEYIDACEESAWAVLEEIALLDQEQLSGLSSFFDAASNPDGSTIFDFNQVSSLDFSPENKKEEFKDLIKSKGTGTVQYTILSNEPLRLAVQKLRSSVGDFTPKNSYALTTIFRTSFYQSLAEKTYGSVYAPSPQRAKPFEINDRLFRARLERMLESSVSSHPQYRPSKLMAEFGSLSSLPLPMLAIHALRNCHATSPLSLLESARFMRDDPEIREIRGWLSKFQLRLQSRDSADRLMALNKLIQLSEDVRREIYGHGLVSDFRPGFEISVDPTGTATSGIDFSKPIAVVADLILRRFEKTRIFIPLIGREFLTDDQVGQKILKMINRPITNS